MAIEQTNNNKGLLALGYKPGDALPFLRDSGVAHRVDSEGLLEWTIGDPVAARVLLESDFLRFQSIQTDRMLRKIFRAGLLFSRALLGQPVPKTPESWPIMPLPYIANPDEIPDVWQKAPYAIQTAVFDRAKTLAQKSLETYFEG
ncbi:MAG: hypothetical protein Q8P84_06875 [Deltaproteobacteria bacterium]|nr:hypothetical protein [Deltaproteobacteria bacterium]